MIQLTGTNGHVFLRGEHVLGVEEVQTRQRDYWTTECCVYLSSGTIHVSESAAMVLRMLRLDAASGQAPLDHIVSKADVEDEWINHNGKWELRLLKNPQ